jgi:predicted Ser/Thr protein kinase
MAEGPPPLDPRDRGGMASGQVVAGRYRVERLLARGGMAAVYLAEQLGLRRRVALKILTPPGSAEDHANFEERFRLEAETLANLNHPNIVILHDYGQTEDGRYFLAMEFVDGPRFTDLLRDGPFTPDRAIALILQVCDALRYAHTKGVIHRDLKPSNLLIRPGGEGVEERVKVVDFGLARLTDHQGITKSGMILGSPHCMAPEQVRGEDVDARTDIYSLGVLLFRSVTGGYPFHGPTSAATMIAHLNQETPTFFSVAPDLQVPSGLEAVVRRCLEKEPGARFEDVAALIGALDACAGVPTDSFESVDLEHTAVTRKLRLAQQRDTWRRWLPGVAVGAVAASVALGGLWLANREAPGAGDPAETSAAAAELKSETPAEVASGPGREEGAGAEEPDPAEDAEGGDAEAEGAGGEGAEAEGSDAEGSEGAGSQAEGGDDEGAEAGGDDEGAAQSPAGAQAAARVAPAGATEAGAAGATGAAGEAGGAGQDAASQQPAGPSGVAEGEGKQPPEGGEAELEDFKPNPY